MSARFITAVLAAGALIATLSTAAPAQAGHDREFKRFLGAAVGLYILGQAIEHHNYRGRVMHHKQYRQQHHKPWRQKQWNRNPCGNAHWDRRTNTCYRYR
ncbi:hypothetical protein [Maliponia aquimaris]|uniref:Uncharacterized protein n=1 Tax=Maliponia aquimaris TaxID=1673631 RepID=A0A238KE55_9RHOB|nr:hypothetical protein [Maliponia aquimaris]SMX40867.1 hypothetical protein MAA8898_02279 [Maliponia aquimaris]